MVKQWDPLPEYTVPPEEREAANKLMAAGFDTEANAILTCGRRISAVRDEAARERVADLKRKAEVQKLLASAKDQIQERDLLISASKSQARWWHALGYLLTFTVGAATGHWWL